MKTDFKLISTINMKALASFNLNKNPDRVNRLGILFYKKS